MDSFRLCNFPTLTVTSSYIDYWMRLQLSLHDFKTSAMPKPILALVGNNDLMLKGNISLFVWVTPCFLGDILFVIGCHATFGRNWPCASFEGV